MATDNGWHTSSPGVAGSLWEKDGSRVAIPHGLTSRAWEWPQIIRRLAGVMHDEPSRLDAQARGWHRDETTFGANQEDGSDIGLDAGVALFATARTAMRSSATTAFGSKPRIAGNWRLGGDRLANAARFGHTRVGSYVVPVYVDLDLIDPSQPGQATLENEDESPMIREPLQRIMTRTLAQSLAALDAKIIRPARQPSTEAIEAIVRTGVSRELVQAVVSLVKRKGGVQDVYGVQLGGRFHASAESAAKCRDR